MKCNGRISRVQSIPIQRITSSVAFDTSWVYNVPSENKNDEEKSDKDGDKKIKDTTEKRFANQNSEGK